MLIGRYKQRACLEAGIQDLHFQRESDAQDAHFKCNMTRKSARGMVPATSGSSLPGHVTRPTITPRDLLIRRVS
jgi:hypothetical protein